MEHINSNWNIQDSGYSLSSHRPVIGKALVTGRKLFHGEVSRYVDPMIWKQKDFNGSIVRILNEAIEKIEEIYSRLREIEDRLSQNQAEILSMIEAQARTTVSGMNQDIEDRAGLVNVLDKRISAAKDTSYEHSFISDNSSFNYFAFEERFRGSQADIKARQLEFLKYFEGSKCILDIGCGRGEFLELLREREIVGHGIDVDEDMVNFCKSKGLDVEGIDAVSYLHKLEDKSIDGIFIDQVVEHLEPEYLIRMLDLCYRKLIYGGTVVVETVNPLSFFSFANFYIDMSHKRPVHPETLKFLINAAGFREQRIEFIAPVPDDARLKKIEIGTKKDESCEGIEIYNHNFDMLNSIIYGPQDYALIGKKL